jgi:hypothetical protein
MVSKFNFYADEYESDDEESVGFGIKYNYMVQYGNYTKKQKVELVKAAINLKK